MYQKIDPEKVIKEKEKKTWKGEKSIWEVAGGSLYVPADDG